MKAAIYAEGRSDIAVIKNILKGYLDIDLYDVHLGLPEYEQDETDLHTPGEEKFSNWTLVKKECEKNKRITRFFEEAEDGALAVIQIDTAERDLKGYEVLHPVKSKPINENYCSHLRANVINKINEWLGGQFPERIAYAVCIEEMDAWVLTLFENKDSSHSNDPKKVLNNLLGKFPDKERKKIFQLKAFNRYDSISNGFRKRKTLLEACKWNISLRDFCESLKKYRPSEE